MYKFRARIWNRAESLYITERSDIDGIESVWQERRQRWLLHERRLCDGGIARRDLRENKNI